MLKEDCPQCPDWPENRPTIPTDRFQDLLSKPEMNITDIQLFLDDSIATETFAMSPPWLIYSLLNVRTGTLTGPNNKHHQGYPFVGHIHRWGDMGFPFYYKLEARKVYGRYNYSLGYELLRKQGEPDIKIYGFGKTDRSKKANVSTVISLSPNIDLRRTRTWGEFASIVYGLLQVARLSGRIAVLPDLPCETSWLYSEEELNDSNLNSTLCLAPLMANGLSWALQYPVDPSTGELIGGWRKRRRRGMTEALNITRDSWWATHQFMALIPQAIGEACIHLGTMVRPEFTNWLRHEGKEGHPHPTESNTVFRLQDPSDQDLQLVPKVYRSEGAGMVYRPVRNKGWSWFDVQAQLSSADVAAEMQRVRSEPVVYMEHPVLIKQVEPSSSQSTSDKSLWAMHEELMTEVRESRVCYLLIDHEEWLRSRKMILPNTDRGVPCIIEKDNSKMIKSAHVR